MTTCFLLLFLFALSACDAGPDPYAAEVNAALARPSDATVDRLREDASGGVALSRRIEALVASDSTAPLVALVEHMTRGDSLDETPRERFGQNMPGGSTPEQQGNAWRLGYVAGALMSALDNRASRLRIGTDADALAALATALAPEKNLWLRAGPFSRVPVGRGTGRDEDRFRASAGAVRSIIDNRARPLDGTRRDDGEPRRYSNEIGRLFENAKNIAFQHGTR